MLSNNLGSICHLMSGKPLSKTFMKNRALSRYKHYFVWPDLHRSTILAAAKILTFIAFSAEFLSVIFSASSSITDATPMCICPCNPTSERSQSTSLLNQTTSSAILTPSTPDQRSSFSVDNLTTTATRTTSASSSLSSSVCYCPCSATSSTSNMLSKYKYRKRLADYLNLFFVVKNSKRVGNLFEIWMKYYKILLIIH